MCGMRNQEVGILRPHSGAFFISAPPQQRSRIDLTAEAERGGFLMTIKTSDDPQAD